MNKIYKISNFLKQSFFITPKEVPNEIVKWVNDSIGGHVDRFEIIQAVKVNITTPWHENDRVRYALFKLITPQMAHITSMEFSRSGLESPGDSKPVEGSSDIPSGYVMVEAHTYPKMARIYTSDDAQQFLPAKQDDELSDDQLIILYLAKRFISSARPIFKDKSLYQSLINKKLLKTNNSITPEGRNIVENNQSKIDDLIKSKAEYYHSNTHLFTKLTDHSPFYTLKSSRWENYKGFKYRPSDRNWYSE